MIYSKTYSHKDNYSYAGHNQHGTRYKKKETVRFSVLKIAAKLSDHSDIQTLVIMSDQLRVPLTYEFETDTAWIEVTPKETLDKL